MRESLVNAADCGDYGFGTSQPFAKTADDSFIHQNTGYEDKNPRT